MVPTIGYITYIASHHVIILNTISKRQDGSDLFRILHTKSFSKFTEASVYYVIHYVVTCHNSIYTGCLRIQDRDQDRDMDEWVDIFPVFIVSYYGVFTLAVSGTGTGTRTGTWANGLYRLVETFTLHLKRDRDLNRNRKEWATYPFFRSQNCFRWCVLMIFQWLSGVPDRANVNSFCIISAPVLVPDTGSVITLLAK